MPFFIKMLTIFFCDQCTAQVACGDNPGDKRKGNVNVLYYKDFE